MADAHTEILHALRAVFKSVGNFDYPPPAFDTLCARFVAFEPESRLVCAFPAQEQFRNTAGAVQGGLLGAAIDHTVGSLAVLVSGRRCVTLTLNLMFQRPIPADGLGYSVEARIRSRSRSILLIEASALDGEGNLAATAAATMAVQPS